MVDIVYGLGGRDFTVDQATRVFHRLENIAATGVVGPVYSHMGQRDLRAEVQ
jgi:pyruvate ferredoxin oxidoreductase alpha subunit